MFFVLSMTMDHTPHARSAAMLLVCIAATLTSCDRMPRHSASTGGASPATNAPVEPAKATIAPVSPAPIPARESIYAEIAARAATGGVLCVSSPSQFSWYVLTNTLPVLVLFHVPPSVPAAIMRAISARIATTYDRRLLVMSVDLTEQGLKQLEAQYAIKTIPTLVYMRDGNEMFRLDGTQAYDEVVPRIEQQMASTP